MDISKIKSLLPANIYTELPSVISKYSINTPLRLAHFLSQASHESAGFTRLVENLNYSAERLLEIFPKYFDTHSAKMYARKPGAIANRVYANRMSNGNEASGDGWRFKGSGLFQLTGRSNYTAFDKVVPEDILSNPDLVATKYPLTSAAWFWDTNKLNTLADKGDTKEVIIALTKRINGGSHGLDARIKEFNKFYNLLK